MNVIGALLSFWVSLTVVWISRGSDLTSREFWLGGWFFGLPMLLLAPLYLILFERLRYRTWVLSAIGCALAPIPVVLLELIIALMRTGMQLRLDFSNPALFTLYLPWYAGFGVLFGAWVGLTGRRARRV